MTILHTETLKKWGGQQNRVLAESLGLTKKGHRAIIVCHKGSVLAEKAKKAGIKVYEVNMVKQAHLKTIPKIMDIIRKEKIDIVSTHSSVDSWAGGIAAKLTGKHLVRFRHNLYPIGRDPLTRLIYAAPGKIISISKAIKDVLIRCGLNGKKITVITSSVNEDIIDAGVVEDLKRELNIPPEATVIGNTSTFTRVKGQEYLFRAFNIICRKSPCFLLVAGGLLESRKSKYLDYVKEEFRDKVILLGHRNDIARVLKTIDVFVYPSYLEGLGTALLEAMAMERPVAVSDIPTFREFIENGVNGLYFKPQNPEDLAEKVVPLVRNKSYRRQIGRNARSTILEKFTVDKMIDRTEALYREVINVR